MYQYPHFCNITQTPGTKMHCLHAIKQPEVLSLVLIACKLSTLTLTTVFGPGPEYLSELIPRCTPA